MKRFLPITLAAALLAGCATIQRMESDNTEQLLSAAGFRILPVNTPEKQAAIAQLKPYTISRQFRGDTVYYVYPDDQRNFVCIGGQQAYSRYQNLVVQQQLTDQNLMAAQMAAMPGMWGGWGCWDY